MQAPNISYSLIPLIPLIYMDGNYKERKVGYKNRARNYFWCKIWILYICSGNSPKHGDEGKSEVSR